MLAPQKAMLKSRGLLLAACLCLTLWLFWSHSTADVALPSPGGTRKAVLPPCRHLVDDHETLLVLRTGATEIADRIPTHIGTTLRCYPNHVIFSDYAETLLGERVLDALESVDPVIIANNKDFEVYRRLKEHGRTALAQSELSGNDTWAPGGSGHEEVAGWKLDKWKFLPMVNQTLYEYPNMKWYIFAEGDSFLVWSTLRALLATLDHTQPLYLGSSTNIGNDPAFAHGGSGFIVSQPAMRIIAEHYSFHKAEIEAIVESSWAGDAVLGKVFFNAGIKLTDVWPVLHGESPGQSLFARPWSPGVPKEYEQVWCYPAASLHHTSPSMLDSLWHYEQQWLEKRANQNETLIRHKDIFKDYVMPQMTDVLMDWDNQSDNDETDAKSIDDCRAACERNSTCTQYSYEQSGGRCKTRINPVLGIAKMGFISGWFEDRIAAFETNMAPCDKEGFDTLPGEW